VNRAPSLILSNVNFVKKVVFPLDVLPWIAMGSTLFHAVVSIGVWALFFLIIKGYLPWTVVFVPLVALPLVLGTLGFAWFLAPMLIGGRDAPSALGGPGAATLSLAPRLGNLACEGFPRKRRAGPGSLASYVVGRQPTTTTPEAPPVDPDAIRREYRRHRARRKARVERQKRAKRAGARFWVVLILLLAVAAVLVLSTWRQIGQLFGL